MLDLVEKARQFALKAHGRIDHRRKYSSDPYPVHLQAVADLIDNCQDICEHDPEFAKVYLAEMAALLEVLRDGDATLYSRAMAVLQENAATLRLPLHVAGDHPKDKSPGEGALFPLRRMAQQFRQTFIARQITRALASIDQPVPETVLAIMDQHRLPVARRLPKSSWCSTLLTVVLPPCSAPSQG